MTEPHTGPHGVGDRPDGAHPAGDHRPNVLVVLTDQQTADAMSATGNPHLATPHMDALAAAGTRYRQAYCAQPLCAPSRASLLTGLLPSGLGVTGNEGGPEPLLGRLFAGAGYDCGYGGKWHLPELDLPEGRGFRRIHPAGDDAGLARAAAAFVREPRDRPFLLVASFLEPHGICEWARGQDPKTGPLPAPPPAADCPPLPANFPPAPYEARLPRLAQRAWAHTHPTEEWREDDWRRYRYAYYALVERVDRHLGTVLTALHEPDDGPDGGPDDGPDGGPSDAPGRRRETVVVFSSDHGDGAGAHRWNQKWALYEESVRVPFLVSGPGTVAGAVSDRLVSTGPDLIPTLCDLAGVTPPPGLPGRSVRAPAPRETVVVETRWELPGFNNALGRMIRDERHKYVCYAWGDHREQLFDLGADPGEMVNLAVDSRYAALLDRFRALLAGHCARSGDPFARFVPAPAAG
ncbi:sulfatase family protein [Kitasatospora sp. NBC_00458]|uniref:sulfatase family protein n=1 Tax=Kitasatospora sp. NBC_00458 TaxID=2903568 RepID=UPI002E17FD18